jgi:hypothetical protein
MNSTGHLKVAIRFMRKLNAEVNDRHGAVAQSNCVFLWSENIAHSKGAAGELQHLGNIGRSGSPTMRRETIELRQGPIN